MEWIRLVAQGLAVAVTVVGLERALSGIVAESPLELVGGAVFLGVLNAAVRPVFRVVRWPVAYFPTYIVLLAVNGIALASVQPISVHWGITLWHGVLAVIVITAVSWGISMAGVNPTKPSV